MYTRIFNLSNNDIFTENKCSVIVNIIDNNLIISIQEIDENNKIGDSIVYELKNIQNIFNNIINILSNLSENISEHEIFDIIDNTIKKFKNKM